MYVMSYPSNGMFSDRNDQTKTSLLCLYKGILLFKSTKYLCTDLSLELKINGDKKVGTVTAEW